MTVGINYLCRHPDIYDFFVYHFCQHQWFLSNILITFDLISKTEFDLSYQGFFRIKVFFSLMAIYALQTNLWMRSTWSNEWAVIIVMQIYSKAFVVAFHISSVRLNSMRRFFVCLSHPFYYRHFISLSLSLSLFLFLSHFLHLFLYIFLSIFLFIFVTFFISIFLYFILSL